MSLYAIGDTHLSLSVNKPMEVFGGRWENYVEKLIEGFSAINDNDVCVICGDISWGMTLGEAREDFLFIHRLPGRKIMLKGNHDYWWTTVGKANRFLAENGIDTIEFLHNNYYPYGENAAICGTRGWFYEQEKSAQHDKKVLDREIIRLEASLKAAGSRDKYVFLHYPPVYGSYRCDEILALLKSYEAVVCCSGHIHGKGLGLKFEGNFEGTRHIMVSADNILFKPVKIIE